MKHVCDCGFGSMLGSFVARHSDASSSMRLDAELHMLQHVTTCHKCFCIVLEILRFEHTVDICGHSVSTGQ